MREQRDLIQFWQTSKAQSFALATITKTEGATYRKAGAQKMIDVDGLSCGLLSGGCLEADIVRGALAFLHENGSSEIVYDSSSEQDRLLGYQKGCRGQMWISFSRLGAFTPEKARIEFSSRAKPFYLKVFGAGADVLPLSELANYMGWRHDIIDHRSDLLDRSRFHFAAELKLSTPDDCVENLKVGDFVVVMTHNYEADLNILKALVSGYKSGVISLSYIGFLGPASRFEQLEKDLFGFFSLRIPSAMRSVIHAPVGIMKTGTAPTEIALSLVAEIQMVDSGLEKTVAHQNWHLNC